METTDGHSYAEMLTAGNPDIVLLTHAAPVRLAVTADDALGDTLRLLAAQARAALDTTRCGVWLFDNEQDGITADGWSGLTAAEAAAVATYRADAAGSRVAPGEALVVEDAVAQGVAPPACARPLAGRSFIAVPVPGPAGAQGLLYLDQRRARRAWTAADIRLATALAGQAAVALSAARWCVEERRQAERAERLRGFGDELTASLDLEHRLSALRESLERLVGMRDWSVVLWDEAVGAVALQYLVEVGRCAEARPWPEPISDPLLGAVLDERKVILTDDYAAECARRGIAPAGSAAGRSGCAWLGLPLLIGERAVGALAVWRHDGPIASETAAMLETATGQIAAALENAPLQRCAPSGLHRSADRGAQSSADPGAARPGVGPREPPWHIPGRRDARSR